MNIFKKFLGKIKAYKTSEQTAKEQQLISVEELQNLIVRGSNTKPLSDTGIFMIFYINVDGLSKAHAEQRIDFLINTYKTDSTQLGAKFFQQIWVAVTEQPTKIDIITV